MRFDHESTLKQLRIIRTARDENSINEAARQGFRPLVKKVEASPEIRSKYAVWQNRKTGEIVVWGDYRVKYDNEDMEQVIDWTYYYPNHFKNPFAAYLIPPDLEAGERVLLEDLIEDHVGTIWSQGNCYRLSGAEAIWTGADFDIQFTQKDVEFSLG